MALTEIPVELSSTPGIADSSNATAITIDSSERVFVGKSTTGLGTSGTEINPGGYIQVTEDSSPSLYLNRLTNTGGIINLYKAGTQTGVIGTDNWGIGTASPSSYNANADDLVIFNDNVHAGITIAGGTDDYGNIYFAQGTSGSDQYRGYIQYGHSATTDANYRDLMVFGTATLERLKIHGDGNVSVVNGNLSFADGHGIDFSATGDATGTDTSELFDDYEEGYASLQIGPDGNLSANYTGTSNNSKYVKIGRFCYITFDITATDLGDGTGTYTTITNLPFAPVSGTGGSNASGGGFISYSQNPVSASIYGNAAVLYVMTAMGGTAYLAWSNAQDNTRLIGTVMFHTAT